MEQYTTGNLLPKSTQMGFTTNISGDRVITIGDDQFNAKTIVIYWDEEINKNDYAGYSNKEILNLMKKTISNDGSILVVSKVLDILDPKMRTFDLHHPSGLANEKLSFAILNNL